MIVGAAAWRSRRRSRAIRGASSRATAVGAVAASVVLAVAGFVAVFGEQLVWQPFLGFRSGAAGCRSISSPACS